MPRQYTTPPDRRGELWLVLGKNGSGKSSYALNGVSAPAPGGGVAVAHGDLLVHPEWRRRTPEEWLSEGCPDRTIWDCELGRAVDYALDVAESGHIRAFVLDEAHHAMSPLRDDELAHVVNDLALEHRHTGVTWVFTSQRFKRLIALEDEADVLVLHRLTSQYARDAKLRAYEPADDEREAWPRWTSGLTLAETLRDERMCHAAIEIDLNGVRNNTARWVSCECTSGSAGE